jgi:hypothetical protein
MKTAAIACIGSLLLAAPAVAQAPAAPPAAPADGLPAWPTDAAGIDALGKSCMWRWVHGMASADAASLERLLHPGFQLLQADGARDRATVLKELKGTGKRELKVTGEKVTRAADAVVVTWQMAVAPAEGAPAGSAEPSCRLAVFVPTPQGWQAAAVASLEMPSPRPAPGEPRIAANSALDGEGESKVLAFLRAQRAKDLKAFDSMMSPDLQVVNFRGQKAKPDLVEGASKVKADEPKVSAARASRCGKALVVTCNLSMGQRIGFTTLPADPAPFLAVFHDAGQSEQVIAIANTNRPR